MSLPAFVAALLILNVGLAAIAAALTPSTTDTDRNNR